MTRETFRTKAGTTRFRPVVEEAELRSNLFNDSLGFCLDCGMETDGVEPDARRYHCDNCGMMGVYGLEGLLMMGLVKIREGSAK